MSMRVTEDNMYLYVAFYSSSDAKGDHDIGLLKIQQSATEFSITWQSRFGSPRRDIGERISVNPVN